MSARVAVVQFPGVNCESESVLALRRVGLEPEVFRWTRPADQLRDYQAFVLPGGFSYQDRVRAGALAAKHPMVEVLAEEAERGKPVLGICNGAQVLVESGMVPGEDGIELALARNRMGARAGYYARWIRVRVDRSSCVFTRHLEPGTVLPLPIAHGEGRFVSNAPKRLATLARGGRAPLRFAAADGRPARTFPDNPNGSTLGIAGICNARGNVLAMMPHPERAQDAGAVARAISGTWDEHRRAASGSLEGGGPGLMLFDGLRRHLTEA